MANLHALTALGARDAAVITVGPLTITERFDVALASVAEVGLWGWSSAGQAVTRSVASRSFERGMSVLAMMAPR